MVFRPPKVDVCKEKRRSLVHLRARFGIQQRIHAIFDRKFREVLSEEEGGGARE